MVMSPNFVIGQDEDTNLINTRDEYCKITKDHTLCKYKVCMIFFENVTQYLISFHHYILGYNVLMSHDSGTYYRSAIQMKDVERC